MLLSGLDITNSWGSVLSLSLEDISSGFVIKSIEGLDPVKATIVSSSFANMDGEQYHSSRREARNIKLTIGLEPDYAYTSVEQLRKQLYSFFMPKTAAIMTFKMFDKFATNILQQKLNLSIAARIESFEAPLFTDKPEAVISLMCFDPDFYDPNVVIFSGNTVSDLTETTLTYDGTVDTGVLFTLKPNRAITAFTIYSRPADQTLRTADFQYNLAAGDILQISSVLGNKYVTLVHGGTQMSVLYALSPQSAWFELQPGDVDLRVYATGAPIPYTIEYTNKYGGL